MKSKRKLFSITFCVISSLFISSCATLDSLQEQLSSLFSSGTSGSQKNGNQNMTKISSNPYKIPEDYSKAYSFRTDKPHPAAKKIPSNITKMKTSNPAEYVRKCCELINSTSEDDFEKVKIAHDIVALNVKYDAKSFWAGTLPPQDCENVLKTGFAVCEGYSNVLKKFLDTLGFQNSKVSGYARGVGTSLLAENSTDSNHAWNMVKIENAYYFIDSTWDSGYMNGKKSVQKYNTDWLFIKPEHFIFTHFPEKKSQQLLKEPVSIEEFLRLADFRPKFFEFAENFVIKDAELPKKTNQVLNSIQFEYELTKDYVLDFSVTLTEKNRRLENLVFTQTEENLSDTVIQFPEPGTYQIQVFYYKKSGNQGTGCAEFFVTAQEGSKIRYPTVYQNSFESKLVSPAEAPLKKGETYHFEIYCPDKNFAAVICGKNFSQMQKNGDGTFSLDFSVPKNAAQLNIGVSSTKAGSYQTVATYACR